MALAVFTQHLFWNTSLIVSGPTEAIYSLHLGGIAVLVFFALSGFLITGKASDPPLKFLTDRVRRVFPLFWIALFLASWWGVGVPWAFPWKVALLVPTGVANAYELPHWSLYFEVFFYLIVFVVMLVRWRWARAAVLLWGAVSFVMATRPNEFANYNVPNLYNLVFPPYALFFAVGIVAGWGVRTGVPRNGVALAYGLAAVFCFYAIPAGAALGLGRFVPGSMPHPDLRAEALALGILFAVRGALHWYPTGVAGRVLDFFGDASFGLYLFHLIALSVASAFVRQWSPTSYFGTAGVLLVLALPPSLLFGVLDVRMQGWLKALQRRWMARREAQTAVA